MHQCVHGLLHRVSGMSVSRQAALHCVRLIGAGAIGCAMLAASPTRAQQDDIEEVSQPVIQAVPGNKAMKLNDALGLLARNPQDVEALIGAGRASMEIGDLDAAVGFFQRADRLSPNNARVKAGLAGAYALSEDPFTAIPMFAEAEKAGAIDPALQADRGLAYDLVGDNASAQKYYRIALAAAPSDETLRRLALSQAISGDRRAMEVTLSPLLQRQDKSAWRTRAFGLAILGLQTEAESIARGNLPGELADSIGGYLAYMPRLTPAQQAAAANLGHFPRASQIGIDDPRVSVFKPKPPVLAAVQLPAPVNPKGAKGKGKQDRAARDAAIKDAAAARAPVQVAAAPNPPPPTREVTRAPVSLAVNTTPAPQVRTPAAAVTVAPPPVPPPAAAPRVLAEAPVRTVPATAAPAPAPPAAGPSFTTLDGAASPVAPGFDLKPAVAAPPPSPPPSPAPPPSPPPVPKPRNLAELFADLTPPSREAVPAAGAVDIRRIGPARVAPIEKAAADDPKARLADECEPDPVPAKGAKGGKSAKDAKSTKAVKVTKGGKTAAAAKTCPVDPKTAKGKSPAASQPSRIWVQVATGRDKSALGFDWRRLVKENPEILGKLRPSISAWGQSNRLLAGPFDSAAAANAVIGKLKKAGVGGAFVWTSPAGQVVDPLGGGK